MPTCSICSEVLGADLSAACCGHVYHTPCINNWLQQKPSCPLCKHKLTSPQQLTHLHFDPKHKLAQLQQLHSSSSSSSQPDSDSSSPSSADTSPFTLHLRVQALRACLDDINLRLEQSTDSLTAVTSELDALERTLTAVTREWQAVTKEEDRMDAELLSQQQSLDTKSSELRTLQLRHRSAYRQLLALRTLPALRRKRANTTADMHPTDLQLLVTQAEATMPHTVYRDGREQLRAALRDEALYLLLRVQVAEVKAEMEELDSAASGLKVRRKRVTELQREEEKLHRELDRLKQQVGEVEQQKAAVLKQAGRTHSSHAAMARADDVAAVVHEVRRASTSDGALLRKRKLSQLSSAAPPSDGREDDDVIVLSD